MCVCVCERERERERERQRQRQRDRDRETETERQRGYLEFSVNFVPTRDNFPCMILAWTISSLTVSYLKTRDLPIKIKHKRNAIFQPTHD